MSTGSNEIPANGGDAGEMKVGGDGKSVTVSGQMGGKRSAWLTHVKKTMRGGSTRGGVATNAAQAGGRRHKKNGTRKH